MSKTCGVRYKAGMTTLCADDCSPLIRAIQHGNATLHALARKHYPGERLGPHEVPGMCSFGLWHITDDAQPGLAPHYNEGIELTMSLWGDTPVMVDGSSYVLHPGEIMITRPWQPHAVGTPHFTRGKLGWLILDVGVRHPHQTWQWPGWVNLSRRDLDLLTRLLRQNEDALRIASAELRGAFERLVLIPAAHAPDFRDSRIAIAVCDVLLRLLELFHLNPVRLRPALMDSSRSVRLYVQKLADIPPPQSVEAMAAACGLKPTRFSALFKEVTGCTPGEYLLRRKLEEAGRLLLTSPGLSIDGIGKSVGFAHGNYFARAFRRLFGMTPSQWRNQPPTRPGQKTAPTPASASRNTRADGSSASSPATTTTSADATSCPRTCRNSPATPRRRRTPPAPRTPRTAPPAPYTASAT